MVYLFYTDPSFLKQNINIKYTVVHLIVIVYDNGYNYCKTVQIVV